MTKRQVLAWTPVVLCMMVIFSFSSQDGAASGATSAGVMELLDPIVEPLYENLPPAEQAEFLDSFHLFIRKTAHFSIYFLLGLFSFPAFGTYPLSRKKQAVCSVLLCLVYACSDEVHQSFVAGRGPSLTDVLLDTAGASTAVILTLGICALRRQHTKKTIVG